jgi:hypothetical protein
MVSIYCTIYRYIYIHVVMVCRVVVMVCRVVVMIYRVVVMVCRVVVMVCRVVGIGQSHCKGYIRG